MTCTELACAAPTCLVRVGAPVRLRDERGPYGDRADAVREPAAADPAGPVDALLVRVAPVVLAVLPRRSRGAASAPPPAARRRGAPRRDVRLRRGARRPRLGRPADLHGARAGLPRGGPRGRVQLLRLSPGARPGGARDVLAGLRDRPGPDEDHRPLPPARPTRPPARRPGGGTRPPPPRAARAPARDSAPAPRR